MQIKLYIDFQQVISIEEALNARTAVSCSLWGVGLQLLTEEDRRVVLDFWHWTGLSQLLKTLLRTIRHPTEIPETQWLASVKGCTCLK